MTETKTQYAHAHEALESDVHETTVQGVTYEWWCDYVSRSTKALDTETGEERRVRTSGYLSNDLSVRKAIAAAFGLGSFRK